MRKKKACKWAEGKGGCPSEAGKWEADREDRSISPHHAPEACYGSVGQRTIPPTHRNQNVSHVISPVDRWRTTKNRSMDVFSSTRPNARDAANRWYNRPAGNGNDNGNRPLGTAGKDVWVGIAHTETIIRSAKGKDWKLNRFCSSNDRRMVCSREQKRCNTPMGTILWSTRSGTLILISKEFFTCFHKSPHAAGRLLLLSLYFSVVLFISVDACMCWKVQTVPVW